MHNFPRKAVNLKMTVEDDNCHAKHCEYDPNRFSQPNSACTYLMILPFDLVTHALAVYVCTIVQLMSYIQHG
jgi:hypothetical protein